MKAASIEFRNVTKRYGDVVAVSDISFQIAPATLVTLLGPSGCGKTTTLRLIAGLELPTTGTIHIGEADVTQTPAAERDVSMVFQSYALFPHMSVLENVRYGLVVSGLNKAKADERARAAMATVGLGGFDARLPSELSGGQQQRVAVARACAFSPNVLLFDEPLSNLDAKLRSEMRIELRELQHRLGVTSLYVTHDLEEALAMSDDIIVMRGGNIEQRGSPGEIYNYPRTAFVADFVGSANLISGRVRPDLAKNGFIALEAGGGNIIHGVAHGRQAGTDATMSVRTVHLQLSRSQPSPSINVWPVQVRHDVFLGDLTQVHVDWGGRELVIRQTAADAPAEGTTAYLSINPEHCVLLEPGEATDMKPPAAAAPPPRMGELPTE